MERNNNQNLNNNNNKKHYRMSSGFIRLSCNYLVKAIDEFEKEGGIELLNQMVKEDPVLRDNFYRVNQVGTLF